MVDVGGRGRGHRRRDLRSVVFTRFWRGDRRGSTGLGLYIVKGLVEAHGGVIEVGRAGRRRPVPVHPARTGTPGYAGARAASSGRCATFRVTPATRRPHWRGLSASACARARTRSSTCRPCQARTPPCTTQRGRTTPSRSPRCSDEALRLRSRDGRPRSPARTTSTSWPRPRSRTRATARPLRWPTARSARCRRRPRREAGKRVGAARGGCDAALDARQAELEAERDERVLVEEAVDVTLPPGRRPLRRPAPARPRSRSGSPTSSSRWAGRSPRAPRSRPSGSTSTRSTSTPTTRPGRCRTPSSSTRPKARAWCCAPTPRRCRPARCSSAELPVYVVCPGRVFRTDELDATHTPVFHQVEGLAVDEGITMAHLKGTLDRFADATVRRGHHHPLRPSYFPFTEPSRRDGPAVLRLPRRSAADPEPAAPAAARAGSSGAAAAWSTRACCRLRRRPRRLHRLRVRHGHRPHADVPPRRRGHARPDRGRRAVRRCRSGWRSDAGPVVLAARVRRPAGRRDRRRRRGSTRAGRPRGRGVCTAATSTGPLVVGQVLTNEPEPQKNGKTDQLVHGRRRDRPTAPASPRASSAAPHNFARRRPGRRRAARRGAARRLRDLRPQDLRPRLRTA